MSDSPEPTGTAPGRWRAPCPACGTCYWTPSQVRRLRDALASWFYPPGQAPKQPTRAEVDAALAHGQWCNRVLHPELEECDCPVRGVVGQLVERGWLTLSGEEAGDA